MHGLAQHTQELVTQRREQRQRRVRQEKVDRIRGMYLGHPDALQDNDLLDYFVSTKEYEDALHARRTIFVGRRGTGKSANFQAVKVELRHRRDIVVVEIAPDDFQLERLTGFLEDEFALVNAKFVYQTVWNYILLSEIVRVLAQESERLYVSPNDPLRTSLYQFYNDQHEFFQLDFGSRLIAKLSEISSIPTDISVDQKRARIEETMRSLRDYQISGRLKEFAAKENLTFFVVADDLDKHWRPDTPQSIELLLGLIAEADRLQRIFEGQIKVVLFLREDIYDVLAQHDEDLPKRNLLRMAWTTTNLKHLVAERMAITAGEDNDNDDDTWLAVFPPKVKGESAADYILSHALPRPRDVLDFCQKAIDQAQRNGHDTVSEEDVLDAEFDFSESLFRSVTLEFRTLYPMLDEVLIEFAGAQEILSWVDFERIAKAAIKKNKKAMSSWYGAQELSPYYLASVLFKTGVIGFAKDSLTRTYFTDGRSFAETWSLVSPDPRVLLHRSFIHALDISPGMSPGRRSSSRRRRDPRQMTLDIPEG